MKVEHIIWEDYSYDPSVSGILELEIYWHGGDKDIFIMQGTYYSLGRGSFKNTFVTIDENTMGVSGISLLRIGHLAE